LYEQQANELGEQVLPSTLGSSKPSQRTPIEVIILISPLANLEELLGLENLDLDNQAQEYLKLLQLQDKVRVEDGVLSTTSLSQGQRKRLALLTAYLENRPIYIFDEWAADQDPNFKDVFYMQILPTLRSAGKTVVVISHDDRYFQAGDRIIKLDYGKIDSDKPV
jgi:putative ATP-binding cassette transporter